MHYLITYRKGNETIELEWIVPAGWGEAAIREAFRRQYPEAEIVSIAACGQGCLIG